MQNEHQAEVRASIWNILVRQDQYLDTKVNDLCALLAAAPVGDEDVQRITDLVFSTGSNRLAEAWARVRKALAAAEPQAAWSQEELDAAAKWADDVRRDFGLSDHAAEPQAPAGDK